MWWQRITRWGREYRYESIAVLNGALIMVLEIVGARMISPYFGSSIYVWTAVIGVILGALSIGYWQGGKLADKVASDRNLSLILMMAAAVLLVALLLRAPVLGATAGLKADIRLQALLAAAFLFGPANALMGMVSPMLAKLKITSLDRAGSSVGGLYAAGTAGSIIGTFAAGYWLISWLGNWALGLWLVVGLVLASALAHPRAFVWPRVLMVAAAALASLMPSWGYAARYGDLVYDGDTAYSRFLVLDVKGAHTLRMLQNDNASAQSGVYLDDPDKIPFDYVQGFVQTAAAAGEAKRVLLVGGGAYTLPRQILKMNAQAKIDVVEIDPKLDELAAKYFGYQPDPRIHIIHEDGRTFLNRNQTDYDLIYMDAFNSFVVPFQLTTSEVVTKLKQSLTPGGAVVVNMVASRSGAKAGFLEAEYATYLKQFELVRVMPCVPAMPVEERQNSLMVAGNWDGRAGQIVAKMDPKMEQPRVGLVLTDDFAPVEQLAGY